MPTASALEGKDVAMKPRESVRLHRVLLVDDEAGQRYLQREILASRGFDISEAEDGAGALRTLHDQDFDVVLLDKRMPGLSGDEVCRRIRQGSGKRLLPVIMVTALADSDELALSLDAGATDFIRKPFSPTELIARVEAAANHKRLLDQLENVESLYFSMARMVEARDWHTGQHCARLEHNGALFGDYLGLDTESIRLLRYLGVLHDIGKLAIPDHILLKKGAFNSTERQVMQQHPVVGAELCSGIKSMEPLVPLIRHHHEHWDGSGYPDGLVGEDIPYLSRVFQLLDIYDAMAAARPYKGPMPHTEVLAHLQREREAGRLDPDLTGQFIRFLDNHLQRMLLPAPKIAHPDDFSILKTLHNKPEGGCPAEVPGDHAVATAQGREAAIPPPRPGVYCRQLKDRLSAILETTTVGLFGLDSSGRVSFVNPAACRMLGFEESELIDSVHHDVVHHSRPDGTPYPKEECVIHRSLHSGHPASGEEMFFHRDGHGIPVEFTCAPLSKGDRVSGVVVTFQDISARRMAEKDLRLAAKVFESTHEAIVITDVEGRILKVNGAFRQITGFSEAEVLGKTPALLNSGEHPPGFFETMWHALKRMGSWQGEVINRTRDGKTFPAWLTISNVKDPRGQLMNFVAVFSDISSLKHSQEQIQHLANHDPLTGLPNRLLFNDRLKVAVRQAQRGGHSVALLFLDLDRFKDINDSMGHLIGDQMLLETASRISQQVRQEDTVARLGGDEFVILMRRVQSQPEVETVAQKVITGLEKPIRLESQELVVTISMGISLFPDDAADADELVRHADAAMYHAKDHGLSEYRFYDRAMSAEAEQRMQLEHALRRALENGEFELYYQPQVDLVNGHWCGAEALVRWQRPDYGTIAPDQFIHVAEITGLIEPLGEWVLRTACYQTQAWRRELGFAGRISVNVSSVQLRRGGLETLVRRVLDESGLPASCLELEITESMIMQNTERVLATLEELRALGVHIAVDDFGTGYSSLSYLQTLPVDTLKIDRAFVRHLPEVSKDAAIAEAIIALGRGLELNVVAEGVETVEQRKFLLDRGCQVGQGWYFARPMPASAFARGVRAGVNGAAIPE